ncbi:hypothetical protein ACFOPN_14415 [Xanthomonas hyacinthi]
MRSNRAGVTTAVAIAQPVRSLPPFAAHAIGSAAIDACARVCRHCE